jgi:hypothetical protein
MVGSERFGGIGACGGQPGFDDRGPEFLCGGLHLRDAGHADAVGGQREGVVVHRGGRVPEREVGIEVAGRERDRLPGFAECSQWVLPAEGVGALLVLEGGGFRGRCRR